MLQPSELTFKPEDQRKQFPTMPLTQTLLSTYLFNISFFFFFNIWLACKKWLVVTECNSLRLGRDGQV